MLAGPRHGVSGSLGDRTGPWAVQVGPGLRPARDCRSARAAGGGLTARGQHPTQDSERRARAAGWAGGPGIRRDSDLVTAPPPAVLSAAGQVCTLFPFH